MTTGVQLSRASIGHHSKSFSLAQKLLPASCRDSAAIVYAWCRRADDAVDELPANEARAALEKLERELDEIYAGVPQADPVVESFRQVVVVHRIPRRYPQELLTGMRMDLEGTEYETLGELLLYCYRVAGTVGLMMCHVMGVYEPRALRHAAHLGIAMQLSNICRDVVEDWGRRRLYVPRSLLGSLRLPARPARFPERAKPQFARAVARLLDEADYFYASGDLGLKYLRPRCQWAVAAARLVYCRIGHVLRARGCDVTLGRAYVPLRVKFGLLLLALARLLWVLPAWFSRRSSQSRRLVALPALRYPSDVLPL